MFPRGFALRGAPQGWGKPYLTKEGLDSLWGAVPPGDSDRYLSIYEYSVEVFAEQKELSDQVSNAESKDGFPGSMASCGIPPLICGIASSVHFAVQIKELRALKVSSIGDAQFHQKEAEYYNTIAAKNPAAVASVPPPPGAHLLPSLPSCFCIVRRVSLQYL